MITNPLDIDCMVHCLDDTDIFTSYATVCASINESTGFVSSVFAHTVGKVSVGLTGHVCCVLQTCGQYIPRLARNSCNV